MRVPELPEVESARAVIDKAALGRVIADVDDSDSYECRPHRPGEIRAAILGRTLTAVHRQGKSIWCETSGVTPADPPGPVLGLHLGMSGKIVIADGQGTEIDGGDYWARGRTAADGRFARFSLAFADGGSLLLVDPRRLGRVRLNPPVERLGPDAQQISAAQFRANGSINRRQARASRPSVCPVTAKSRSSSTAVPSSNGCASADGE